MWVVNTTQPEGVDQAWMKVPLNAAILELQGVSNHTKPVVARRALNDPEAKFEAVNGTGQKFREDEGVIQMANNRLDGCYIILL